MAKKAVVFLEEIAENIDIATDCMTIYLNRKTGAITELFDETSDAFDEKFADETRALAEEIENNPDDYIALPGRYDVNDFEIMQDFADRVRDAGKQARLFRALSQRRPFRNFKDALYDVDLSKEYYAFRDTLYLRAAKEWCEANEIAYRFKNAENEAALEAALAEPETKPEIDLETLRQIDVRVGTIVSVSAVKNLSDLQRLTVDFGTFQRNILVVMKKEREDSCALEGMQALFVVNLEPFKVLGERSEGKLFATGGDDILQPVFVVPEKPVPNGTWVG